MDDAYQPDSTKTPTRTWLLHYIIIKGKGWIYRGSYWGIIVDGGGVRDSKLIGGILWGAE